MSGIWQTVWCESVPENYISSLFITPHLEDGSVELLVMGEGDTPAECYQSDAAWDYIDKFIDNLDGIVLSSSSQVYKGVIDGEYAVGVSYEDPVVQAIIDNAENPDADLSLVYPEEGAVWLPAGVAIGRAADQYAGALDGSSHRLSGSLKTISQGEN